MFFLILTATFCEKCPNYRRNIVRLQQIPRDVFGFYKGFIMCNFKNPKDISCKASQLSILRLWKFGPTCPFKSAATTQKWPQRRYLPSFSDFTTMIFRFLILENIPTCIYSLKGQFLSLQIQIF